MKEEKRKHPRIHSINLISVQEIEPEDAIYQHGNLGATVNLSKGGVLFESKYPIPLLATVKLSMTLEDHLLELIGRVVRLEEIHSSKIAIAIQFTDVSPEAEAILDKYIAQKEEKS